MAEALDLDVEDLNKTFVSATHYVKTLTAKLSENQMLDFYAFYKQATEGPCTKPQPSWYQMVEKQKWQAWSSLKDMDCSSAMKKYINLLSNIDSNWQSKTDEPDNKQQCWVYHSSMVNSDEYIPDSDKTVFDWVKEDNLSMLQQTVERKRIDVNVLDGEGIGLLHWAADRGHLEIVKYLITHKADVNLRDSSQQTALHYACGCDHVEVVKFLLQSGANSSLKDNDDLLPFDVSDSKQIKDLLQQCSV